MKKNQITNNFYIWEFVPPDIWEQYGENSIWFIDYRLPIIAQHFRDVFNTPVWINTWKYVSSKNRIPTYTQSGFRPSYVEIGAYYSQHKFGRAIDFKTQGYDAEEVRNYIRDNYATVAELGLTTIEKDTKTWVHGDIRETINKNKLYEVPYR